jgi:hypothetical protein
MTSQADTELNIREQLARIDKLFAENSGAAADQSATPSADGASPIGAIKGGCRPQTPGNSLRPVASRLCRDDRRCRAVCRRGRVC